MSGFIRITSAILLLTIVFCMSGCAVSQKNEANVFVNNKKKNDYDVLIDFVAMVDGNLQDCSYYITDKCELYMLCTDYPDLNRQIDIDYLPTDAKRIDLDKDSERELQSIATRLDHNCKSRVAAIVENIPYIIIRYNNGDEGGYYYGEPENNAFNEIVKFCIDNSPNEIKRANGSAFLPYEFSPYELNIETHDCIIKPSNDS